MNAACWLRNQKAKEEKWKRLCAVLGSAAVCWGREWMVGGRRGLRAALLTAGLRARCSPLIDPAV